MWRSLLWLHRQYFVRMLAAAADTVDARDADGEKYGASHKEAARNDKSQGVISMRMQKRIAVALSGLVSAGGAALPQ